MTRNRLLLIVGATVIVVAVIVVLIVTNGSAKTTRPTNSPKPTTTTSQSADAAPSGCLGGTSRNAAMVIAAQKAAPHTTNGAVEVATALVRWTFRSPIFNAQEANEVRDKIIASSATPEFKDLAGGAASNPNNSGGVVPDGTNFYLSTAQGVWYIESATSNEVKVSIGAAYVINGAVSPQLRSSSTVDMVWETGGWHAKSGSITRTTEDLFKIGTGFTGGC